MRHENYELFLDMDGVTVDLDKLFVKLYGKSLRQMPKDERNKAWREDFRPEWFLEAPPMEDLPELLNWATARFANIRSLTALPSRRPDKTLESLHAKTEWHRKHLPKGIPLTFGPHAKDKRYHCHGRNFILIDDNEQNVTQWIKAGGIGVLHTSAKDSIQFVDRILLERFEAGER